MTTSKMNVLGAPTPAFDSLSQLEKQIVADIYERRRAAEDFPAEIIAPATRLEFIAREYMNQLRAFEDVLASKGFEPVTAAPHDYDGRIAALSYYGTLVMLGKPKRQDGHWIRIVTSSRIHRPELTFDGVQGRLVSDPVLGDRLRVKYVAGNSANTYKSSSLRGLAVNPEGAGGDQRVEHAKTVLRLQNTLTGMGEQTMRELLDPTYDRQRRA